ncbi:hypothetical protein PZB74_10650 [Porifericola rhodea]|uniref:hypothetical protein n=1 Tax=Porifericola rhodea TaxID=930972 RepID=UPI00266510D1|nr:hypothetical protein [Porifericola rhodea]WKN33783.1 hypothetical protein PZB74_10650 [Porifericola rhodea]
MNKRLLLLVLICLLFARCNSTYRIKQVRDGKGEFIIPPKSDLSYEEGSLGNDRYHYVYLKNLKWNAERSYFDVIQAVDAATHTSKALGMNEYCFDVECFDCDEEGKINKEVPIKRRTRKIKKKIKKREVNCPGEITSFSVGDFAIGKYSKDGNEFLLQIDYEKILEGTEDEIDGDFYTLAFELLAEFSSREDADRDNKKWPPSISQSIVEKIFELIPIPQSASLARYGCWIDGEKSFTLVSPKIKLKVDAVGMVRKEHNLTKIIADNALIFSDIVNEKREREEILTKTKATKEEIEKALKSEEYAMLNKEFDLIQKLANELYSENESINNWQYRLIGTNILQVNRDKHGLFIQNSFHDLSSNTLPDNTISGNFVLQASSEDIQLSETLRKIPYIFLYQRSLKGNNLKSNNFGCDGSEEDIIKCNAQLWHFSDLAGAIKPNRDLNFRSVDYVSSFGYRNVIVPLISVYLNENLIHIPMNTNLNQIVLSHSIPSTFSITRLHQEKYKKVEDGNLINLILLPGDKIKF